MTASTKAGKTPSSQNIGATPNSESKKTCLEWVFRLGAQTSTFRERIWIWGPSVPRPVAVGAGHVYEWSLSHNPQHLSLSLNLTNQTQKPLLLPWCMMASSSSGGSMFSTSKFSAQGLDGRIRIWGFFPSRMAGIKGFRVGCRGSKSGSGIPLS